MKMILALIRWGLRIAVVVALSVTMAVGVLFWGGAASLLSAGLALAGAETAWSSLQADLADSRARNTRSEKRLARAERARHRAAAELKETRAKLAKSQKLLTRTRHDLTKVEARLAAKEAELLESRQKLARAEGRFARSGAKLDRQKQAVRKLTRKIARRTEWSAVRNVAAVPGEALPWAGGAVAVAVTVAEVGDACANMEDMEALNSALGIDDAEVDRSTVCGLEVPSVDELSQRLPEAPGEVWDQFKAGFPEISLPGSLGGLWEQIPAFEWPPWWPQWL